MWARMAFLCPWDWLAMEFCYKFAACVFIIPIDSHDETLSALPCDVFFGGSQLAPVGHRAQLLPEAEGGLWTGRQRVARRKPRSISGNGKTYSTLIVMDREDAVGNQWRWVEFPNIFQNSSEAAHLSDSVRSHRVGPRISPLPCHQLEPSDRGLVEASVHLLHFATNSHPTTCCMINKWCCMIKHHVTNPPSHKSSTEVVVDGPLRQPMVWDLDYTFSSHFWKVHLIASQPWNCQNNLHDLPAWRWLNHQADYIACSEKNAEYDVQGSLGLFVMILVSPNLICPSPVNSCCPSSAFHLKHSSSPVSKEVQCFQLGDRILEDYSFEYFQLWYILLIFMMFD